MLSDAQVKSLKPQEKRYSTAGGEGLNIIVHPNGKKKWVLSYRVNGKQNQKNIGDYPEVSCKEARQIARTLKVELSGKVLDAPTVKAVREEWLAMMKPQWSMRNISILLNTGLNT